MNGRGLRAVHPERRDRDACAGRPDVQGGSGRRSGGDPPADRIFRWSRKLYRGIVQNLDLLGIPGCRITRGGKMKLAFSCSAVVLLACACSSNGEVANPDPAARDAGGYDGPVLAASDGPVALDTIDHDGSVFAPEQCRWEGYGIGAPPDMQCDQRHLFPHAVEACLAVGGSFPDGTAIVTRDVSGACTSGPQEVQVLCCFRGALPTAEDVPVSPLRPRDRHVSSSGAAASSGDLVTIAQTDCLDANLSLGDWSVLYGPDGVSAQFIRFYCT